jgi:hypothetical protein
MNKPEAVEFMVKTISETNRLFCERGGMDKAEVDKMTEASLQSLNMICDVLYDRMKQENLIA